MSQNNRFEQIQTSGGLEGTIRMEAMLSNPAGKPGILFFNDDDFLFALPLEDARKMYASLGRVITRAEEIAERYGPMVRRAAKAEGN